MERPERLGDYDNLKDLLDGEIKVKELDKELLIAVLEGYLKHYGRHPVLYGRAIEPRGTGGETIREYAEWSVRELFVALDWAIRTERGIDANRLHAVEARK